MLLAYKTALASPRIRATAIEATEFPALADAHDVLAVPKTVAGETSWEGAVPEQLFVQRVLAAAR